MTGGRLFPSGRRRIREEDVELALTGARSTTTVVARITSDAYGEIPPDARVSLVIIWSRWDHRHVELGTWAARSTGMTTTFPAELPGTARARLLVADPTTERLIATAESLKVTVGVGAIGASSLLQARYVELGQVPYRLDFDPSPSLLINSRLKDPPGLESDPMFVALVWPQVVRQVADWLCRDADDEQAIEWTNALVGGTHLETPPNDEDPSEQQNWVDEVVKHACDQHSPTDLLSRTLKERS